MPAPQELRARNTAASRLGPARPASPPTAATKGTAPAESAPAWSLGAAAKVLLLAMAMLVSLSQLLTGTLLFRYEIPEGQKLLSSFLYAVGLKHDLVLTPEELATFDGSDASKPVYVAILGDVFDVTAAKDKYRVGTSYSFFGGRDASRAYATGCFETHLTHDIRGLSESELAAIRHWHNFFSTSKMYFRVGVVKNPALTAEHPIPKPCKSPKGQKSS